MIEIADPRLGPRDRKDIDDPKFAPFIFKSHQICKQLNDGSILRIFRASGGAPYNVQRICNPGVLDRRRKPASRERREILLTSADRAEAVLFFNNGENHDGQK